MRNRLLHQLRNAKVFLPYHILHINEPIVPILTPAVKISGNNLQSFLQTKSLKPATLKFYLVGKYNFPSRMLRFHPWFIVVEGERSQHTPLNSQTGETPTLPRRKKPSRNVLLPLREPAYKSLPENWYLRALWLTGVHLFIHVSTVSFNDNVRRSVSKNYDTLMRLCLQAINRLCDRCLVIFHLILVYTLYASRVPEF